VQALQAAAAAQATHAARATCSLRTLLQSRMQQLPAGGTMTRPTPALPPTCSTGWTLH
jgi:hypothetical protein